MTEYKKLWMIEEERIFEGWNFSFFEGRVDEDPLHWDYRDIVKRSISSDKTILDMGTGGGEFLLSLHPPSGRTYATEAYRPNYELCKRRLPPHGIDVTFIVKDEELPYDSGCFDLVMNRHEAYSPKEVKRILKPGGMFITQQVGGRNNRELSAYLLGDEAAKVDDEWKLEGAIRQLAEAGFEILQQEEQFPVIRFRDVGALVYYAKIIEWEFPGFTVEKCFDRLTSLQERLERQGYVESMEHRFLIVARKPYRLD
ncbi:class I SAM-dependent methyltransferase [Paenibacillus tarimensis]|uniref:class I SAM-dependent methyltransferase n=1 Tax=Paenibacillus tarimensis TaxID=416012 RepID=UPI001F170A5F|nr:class I SAM-dependent methyltransferase [Paenibacillus tarimensis]MCF2944874.1 class I SAM-dependent methyltransferase [Paenibacillus tarimensis]